MANADRIIELLHEAKARPVGAARERFIAEACGDDAALREQIFSLLKADSDEGESDFLKNTPINRQMILVTEKPGDRIGRYKLLEQIGEGGCGVVYMAEQQEPVRRRVALKIIKLGMDTKQVIARFEAERQALAMMDHPNIAKIYDAGVTEGRARHSVRAGVEPSESGAQGTDAPYLSAGRPYFVMELVRGIKITDYCDQNNLSTEERLKLFMQVCHAIQHAHQKGIIHRDIKPSNILVTQHDDVAVPKVIDFGIAKATVGQLTDKTVFTAFAQFIGTPAYMSPEQAQMSGLDVDTRADIYSLGVLLYELLTGHTPFNAKELLAAGVDEMRRKIREEEPAKPSTRLSTMQAMDLTTVAKHRHVEPPKLIHLIRGDLDWLVMKCLEKDRARRYETANGLAVDIQRHLDNEPVSARPPGSLYRFQKLIRRHKLAFVAGAVVLLVLLGGIAVSTWQAVRATRAEREQTRLREQAENARINEARQRAKAESESAKSQQVAEFLKDMLKGVGPSVALGRDTTMMREIVDKIAERIGTDLRDQPEVEIELRLTLTQVHFALQEYKKMEQAARGTLQLARAHFGEENLAVADSLGMLGRALFFARNLDEAENCARQAIALQRKLRGDNSLQEAASLCNLGDVLRHQSYRSDQPEAKRQIVEAETAIRAGLAIFRSRLGNDNDDVAWALHTLQHVLKDEGKGDEAEAAIREGLAIRRKIHGEEHPDTGFDYCCLGDSLGALGRIDEAASNYRKGLDILERTAGKAKWHQAWGHNGLAQVLAAQGKPGEAEIHHRQALALARQEMGADHPDLPEFICRLASILRKNGKLAEARLLAEESMTLCQRHPDRIGPHAFATLQDLLTDLGDTAALEKLNSTRETPAK